MPPYSMPACYLVAGAVAVFSEAAAADHWSLRLPKEDKVVYKGLINSDRAGLATGPQLLYGPGLVGFFATLAVHGAVVDTQRIRQMEKMQEEADKVLLPHQDALSGYTYAALMQKALDRSLTPGAKKLAYFPEKPQAGWFIESLPVFGMTHDRKAIVLENAISIYSPGASDASYQGIIKVLSQPKDEADLIAFWNADQGEKLKEESANLLAHSLDMAIAEATGSASAGSGVQKTLRYLEGSAEKMERANLVSEYCNRAVIKTLRGWLMSVPTKPGPAATPPGQCASAPNNL